MAEFSAGAVMTMLGIVETTVVTLFLYLSSHTATEDDLEDVEETAEAAHDLASTARNEASAIREDIPDDVLDDA